MNRFHGQIVRACLGLCAFLAVALYSPPITSSIPEGLPEPPSLDEVVVLQELHEWVEGVGHDGVTPLAPYEMGAAIRERPESFALFSTYHPLRERRRLARRLPYGGHIGRAAVRHDVDPLLLAALVEAESSFNPYAISVDGALGLVQVLPETAGKAADELMTPSVNLDSGARYLAYLQRRFDGDVVLALAAYNAGPGAVERFGGLPPYRETRAYVARVLSRYVDHNQTLWHEHMRREWHLY